MSQPLAHCVGRKNHYGSKSARGTQVAATLYSLLETSKQLGRNEHSYLLRAAQHALQNPGAALLLHNLLGINQDRGR